MADCTCSKFRSKNQAKENQKNKINKQINQRTEKMVSQLIECLAAYNSKMEYQNKDFDAHRGL